MTGSPLPDRELIVSIHEMAKRLVEDLRQVQIDVRETRKDVSHLAEADIRLEFRVQTVEQNYARQTISFDKLEEKVNLLEDEVKTRLTQLRTIIFLAGPILAVIVTFIVDLVKSWVKVP